MNIFLVKLQTTPITNFLFPALNVSSNFATIDYDAHINTKIDYTISHVFRSMTVQELNTLHTICELEHKCYKNTSTPI